ncbi:hypothetical protein LuPra_04907 [Luteitalea pratensis]|uniref:Uncharacterized protein n=1 Tax=Luteitalea pratensis TaxID=1855912 RepID=A0A143PTD9_LUTPR|nr:hypothetical protein LuPra_04907 [Luteitalea pratensis]
MEHHGADVAGRHEQRQACGVGSNVGAAAFQEARPRGSTPARRPAVTSAAPDSSIVSTTARIGRAALRMAVYLTTRMEHRS